MKNSTKNNLYKIITVGSIMLASINFASAEGFSSFLKSVFFEDTKIESKNEQKNNKLQTYTISTTTDTASTTAEPNLDTDIDLINMDIAADKVICEIETKLQTRNSIAKVQMKKQTYDKNKIIVSLEKVASSSDDVSSKIVHEKIVKLEKEFSDIVKIENNIVDVASTTINIACDDDAASEKLVSKNLLKIKKLELEKDKQINEVKILIKKEIKNTLKSLL